MFFFFSPQECLTTGFRFSVTHDDPPFGQSEPHDECNNSSGDDSLVQQLQHQHDGGNAEKPVTCDYLSPYAFTARNSLGSTSGTRFRPRPKGPKGGFPAVFSPVDNVSETFSLPNKRSAPARV